MAFAEDQCLVRLQFTFSVGGTAVEIQDTGFWVQILAGTGVSIDWDDVCTQLATLVRDTWVTAFPPSWFSNSLTAFSVIAYHYDQPHENPLNRAEIPFSGSGHTWAGTATTGLPAENSVVASLFTYAPGTFVPRPGTRKGRMYLPTIAQAILNQDGTVDGTHQGNIADSVATLMAAVYDHDFTGGGGSITAAPIVVSVAAATSHPVTHVRVGKAVDTQRRRRNKIPESYVTVTVSP